MKKIELLAPAGGIEQYIAAVENGADAIYLGGSLYNARMNAANFTLPELEKVVDYGHLRNVKTYVAMNTLISDGELNDAVNYAKKLYKIGVDALIIQDLGLGRRIKKEIPDFELHLSTQATVYNKEGVSEAKKLGYDRVVLAREVSREDIKSCVETGVDIEYFVHGALCFCYSGQCQLSRFIGGRSGNKGGCAQPCRLEYKGGENAHPLSPKDLSLIDDLGELIDLGVASLKIEGRMKSPEYVGTVVRIYRKYIDEYIKNGKYQVSFEDRMDLTQIFNRGGFTEGYLNGNPGKSLLSGELPKNQGILVGEVIKQNKNGLLTDAQVYNTKGYNPLKMGDVIEVHSKDMFTTKVTYFADLGGGKYRIGDMKGDVMPGDKIFRIVSDDLMNRARNTYENIEVSGHYQKKTPIDVRFFAKIGCEPKINVSGIFSGKRINAEANLKGFTVNEAINRATEEKEILEKLSKTGGTPFSIRKVDLIMDRVFMPISKINELRRLALEKLEENVKAQFKREISDKAQETECEKIADFVPNYSEILFYSFDDFEDCDLDELTGNYPEGERKNIRILLPVKDVVDNFAIIKTETENKNLRVIPYIPNVIRGKYNIWLKDHTEEVLKACMALSGELYVGNLGEINLFKDRNISLIGDTGLNIYNKESFAAYGELGLNKAQMSLEDIGHDQGSFPLMITEHEMPDGVLEDRKGAKYTVRYYTGLEKSIITGENVAIDWQNAVGKRVYIDAK